MISLDTTESMNCTLLSDVKRKYITVMLINRSANNMIKDNISICLNIKLYVNINYHGKLKKLKYLDYNNNPSLKSTFNKYIS